MERKASVKAKQKYNTKNYDRLYISVIKGKKDVYNELAKAAGYSSLNTYVEDLLDRACVANGYEQAIKDLNGGAVIRQRKYITKAAD